MTSTVTSLAPAHAVIQVVHVGDVSASDMRGVSRQVRDLTEGMAARHVLSDFSEATSLPGLLELLNFVDLIKAAGVGDDFRQAFIWPKDPAARLELEGLKTGERNQGLHAQMFGDRESALAWLES